MTRLRPEKYRFPAWARAALAIFWIVGAVVVWNVVFDAHITAGASAYVERQRAFAAGRGPRADIREAMAAARQSGLRAAWQWTLVELAGGAAVVGVAVSAGRRGRASRPGASR